MIIYKACERRDSWTPTRNDLRLHDNLTDTDHSLTHTSIDVSDEDSNAEDTVECISSKCFYNYFYYGFNILISSPTTPSRQPPSLLASPPTASTNPIPMEASAPLIATKIILHSNVPGSYSFNCHCYC